MRGFGGIGGRESWESELSNAVYYGSKGKWISGKVYDFLWEDWQTLREEYLEKLVMSFIRACVEKEDISLEIKKFSLYRGMIEEEIPLWRVLSGNYDFSLSLAEISALKERALREEEKEKEEERREELKREGLRAQFLNLPEETQALGRRINEYVASNWTNPENSSDWDAFVEGGGTEEILEAVR